MYEIWKDIPGFPGYEISNLGQVKRLAYARFTPTNPRGKFYQEKFNRSSFTLGNGWVVATASKVETVARLLLTAFVRPPKRGEQARHLDDNKHNQMLENLAWGTQVDNMFDALRNGRRALGKRLPHTKLTDEQVLEIKTFCAPGDVSSYKYFSKKYGVKPATIADIVRGRTRKHVRGLQ